MFYREENWEKYSSNKSTIDKMSLQLNIDRMIVEYYLNRNRLNLLKYYNEDLPLYLEIIFTKNINSAANFLINALKQNLKTLVIYDRDLDGFGAARIVDLINEDNFRSGNLFFKEYWNNIPMFNAEDAKEVLKDNYECVIFLDMGQNSDEGISYLKDNGVKVCVMDHHLQDFFEIDGVTYYNPNFEYSGYPSAAGMVYLLKRQIERVIKYPAFGQTYCILDIETTGLDPVSDDVIEISILRTDGGEIVKKCNCLLRTDKKIPKNINEITGISNELCDKHGKDPQKILKYVKSFIADHPIVAHNVNFDISFLNNKFDKYGIERINNELIDTVMLSKMYFPNMRSYSLENITRDLNIYSGKMHRADSDTQALHRLFLEIQKKKFQIKSISKSEELLIYYITLFSDRMKMDGLNYLIIKKYDETVDFPKLLEEPGYNSLLTNSLYVTEKIIPVLNSKYRDGFIEDIVEFFKTKKLNMFRRSTSEPKEKFLLKNATNLNPNGRVAVYMIEKKFMEKKGAIASQISKDMDTPCVIIIQDDPLYGSARFLWGDILNFFKDNEDLFISFGGHGKAVGFALQNFRVPDFILKMESWFQEYEKLSSENTLYYDSYIPVDNISDRERDLIRSCGPYGNKMTPATFLDKRIEIISIKRFGAFGKSLYLELRRSGKIFIGISLYNGKIAGKISTERSYDILYYPLLKQCEKKDVIYIVDMKEN